MSADIGVVRAAIAAALAQLPDPLMSYEVGAGSEFPPCAIVFPRPSPEAGGFHPTNSGFRYDFVIEMHTALAGGVDQAQRAMDTYVSPRGTHANSVEGALLANPTLSGIVKGTYVEQFRTYTLGRLNSKEPNTIMATIPLWVDVE